MKKLISLLLIAMLSCSMLFAGCEKKSEQIADGESVDVESVTDLDAIRDAGIVKFIPVADNGLGVRPIMTAEEIKEASDKLLDLAKKGVHYNIRPEIDIYSGDEYLDFIAKNPLPENFVKAENFAPIEYLTNFTKYPMCNEYMYTFDIDGNIFHVTVTYGKGRKAVSDSAEISAKNVSIDNILERKGMQSNRSSKISISEEIKGIYQKGYLTQLLVYTEYAEILLYASYSDDDYVRYGQTVTRELKDGAQAKFGEVMSSLNSWASNFTDVKKIDAAVADANRYAKKDSAVK